MIWFVNSSWEFELLHQLSECNALLQIEEANRLLLKIAQHDLESIPCFFVAGRCECRRRGCCRSDRSLSIPRGETCR